MGFGLIFILIFSGAVSGFSQTATIQQVSGRVEIQAQAGGPWIHAQVGSPLSTGATLSVGLRSSATVDLGNAQVQVDSLSRLRLDELVTRGSVVSTELYLPVGRVRTQVNAQSGLQQEFRLHSPVATAAVRGTSFDFDGQNLQVQTGLVQVVNNQGQQTLVARGESTAVQPNAAPPSADESFETQSLIQVLTNPLERFAPSRPRFTRFVSGLIVLLPQNP